MDKINVLVVDDSAFMRKMITDILNGDPQLHVVGTARNGQDALKKIPSLLPDVITLDVEMPVMDGLETLGQIMSQFSIPVIMLSSVTKRGAEKTIQAISLGAIDFITKPSGSISLDIQSIQAEITTKVIAAAKSKVSSPTVNDSIQLPQSKHQPIDRSHPIGKKVIVAIGTSTGGPRALQQVLTHLPQNFPAPIAIVQHMPKGFTKSLAERLDSLSDIHVKEAENGEVLVKGTAYIAPGGYHLGVKQMGRSLIAEVYQSELRNGHQPSVDVLFESLAQQKVSQVFAVVMTGMGADGSKGLHTLKKLKRDSFIMSESNKTAVVYGMPQAAVKTNLVNEIVDLDKICSVLVEKINV
ncbi:protein-glutamate methylesterase/protein-glutamine glutaminase [Aquibacillus sediminis]|uniref:protein-glutamate methylesterase/protein-glutamine glutaminase n=1 Tax=Aquibacillus sediminis TaxID=2574734 RepID=UPI0011096243|nr:chemotaxis response regulator protein-glutamate methylesterase [Aquibacillus sediminis]